MDPQWQRKFSIIWPSVLAFFVLLSLPHLVRSIRNGRAYSTFFGISEDLSGHEYLSVSRSSPEKPIQRNNPSLLQVVEKLLGLLGSVFYWTLPGFGLNAGQSKYHVVGVVSSSCRLTFPCILLVIVVAAYVIAVVLCIVLDAPLVSNSNRAGKSLLRRLVHHPMPYSCMPLFSRVFSSRSIPGRVLVRYEELRRLPSFGSGKWIRETQLRSPVVWPYDVSWRTSSWILMD